MKWLIISDIHANIVALESVLADATGFDSVVCLGDVTGYGPHLNECCERMMRPGATHYQHLVDIVRPRVGEALVVRCGA